MRGPRLFDHTDWKSKKRSSRPQIFCFHWKYRYSEEQKKRYTRPQMFFPLKVPVKRKKNVFIVRDEVSHFLRGPRFQPAYPTCKSGPMLTIHI